MKVSEKIIDEDIQGKATLIQSINDGKRKLYLESYGCQMNFSDSEIVASILAKEGFKTTENLPEADLVLVNTCAIRDNAEQRVRNRLQNIQHHKKNKPEMLIGLLGCMAERLKSKLLEEEKLVDIVVGPDAYRDLPKLVSDAGDGHRSINVMLSREETYADVNPIRLNSNGITAFISIMRGCDNMCSFCVVPFTRGRERSRDPESIVHEAKYLFEQGYREVTLLGQNVDSYRWIIDRKGDEKEPGKASVNFAHLLEKVALVNKDLRVRFSTSHPKDMTDEALEMIAKHENICDYIHLPIQSGSNSILKNMNRGYTRKWYLERMNAIRRIIPECGISTDFMTGFCGETANDHLETLDIMKTVGFDFAYMFKYSERPKTLAERKLTDDVSEDLKSKRLREIMDLQALHSAEACKKRVGKKYRVLIEGTSKKSEDYYYGRNSQNTVVVFPKEDFIPGEYVNVYVDSCTAATLIGNIVHD